VPPAERSILVIEDDAGVRETLRLTLQPLGYYLMESDRVDGGLHLLRQRKPDLVVLDIELPDGNGFDICRKIRDSAELAATPVIMLTGKTDLESKLSGFSAGADQYLVKPLHPKEFLAWVEALFHRQDFYRQEPAGLTAGRLNIDVQSRLIRFDDAIIANLTAREFDLLYYLVKNRPRVMSRDAILKQAWKTVGVDNLVDSHLNKLRRKVPAALSDKIQAVPGKGYRYME
jgi:DNA-binding response OmpR family regulator